MKNRWHSDKGRSCGYNVSTAMVKDWKKKKETTGGHQKKAYSKHTLCHNVNTSTGQPSEERDSTTWHTYSTPQSTSRSNMASIR